MVEVIWSGKDGIEVFLCQNPVRVWPSKSHQPQWNTATNLNISLGSSEKADATSASKCTSWECPIGEVSGCSEAHQRQMFSSKGRSCSYARNHKYQLNWLYAIERKCIDIC